VGVDSGSGLAMPNLIKIANAYGIKTVEINNHKEMNKKLKGILKSKVSVLCDVKVDEKQKVIPKLEFGKAIHDLSPRLSVEEMNLNIIKWSK
jgi:acetolactate synthase-1/2/3 large subunit